MNHVLPALALKIFLYQSKISTSRRLQAVTNQFTQLRIHVLSYSRAFPIYQTQIRSSNKLTACKHMYFLIINFFNNPANPQYVFFSIILTIPFSTKQRVKNSISISINKIYESLSLYLQSFCNQQKCTLIQSC